MGKAGNNRSRLKTSHGNVEKCHAARRPAAPIGEPPKGKSWRYFVVRRLVETQPDPAYIEMHRKCLACYQTGAAENQQPKRQPPPVPSER
jgi:hypothetical protein